MMMTFSFFKPAKSATSCTLGEEKENTMADDKVFLSLKKQWQLALLHYDTILEKDPTDIEALMGRGFTAGILRDYNQALDSYLRVLKINPEHRSALYQYALLLRGINRKQEAIETYKKLLINHPDDIDAVANLAILLRAHGEMGVNLAWAYCKPFLKEAPETLDIMRTADPHTLLIQAKMLRALGYSQKAAACCKRISEEFNATYPGLLVLKELISSDEIEAMPMGLPKMRCVIL
jgi:tetratricopeptide (TPR) repeat protein